MSDLRLGVYGAGLITVLGLIAGLLNSAFVSNLRFGYAGAVNLLVNHVPQLTCLVAYVSGKTLGASLLMGGLATGFVVIAQIVVLWDEESGMEPTGSSAEWEGLWPFVGATVGFSLQTITSALVMPLLQTIVGAKLGPQANGLLDVSRRLLFAGRQAVEGLFVPVFSRTTALLERRQVGDIRRLAKSTAVASVVAAVSYFLGFTVFLPVIVRLWLGTDRAGPVLVAARVLLYGASFTCLNIGTFYVLSAFPKGRRVNAVAGTVTLAVLLIGFLQPIRTFKEITTVYAVATLAGSLLTMGLAFRLLPRLLVLRTPAA